MKNAREDTPSNYGRPLLIVSTVCQLLPLVSLHFFTFFFQVPFLTKMLLFFTVDEKIFCCHGGLSPDLHSMEQIRRIMRPTDVPDQGLLCDLLWSDPDKDTNGWGENDRGVSFTFGIEVSEIYIKIYHFFMCAIYAICIKSGQVFS